VTGARGPAAAAEAWADYRNLADAVGVEVRTITAEDASEAAALLEQIWGVKPIEPAMLISLAHTGSYAVVAVDGHKADAPETNDRPISHSHGDSGVILGVTAGYFAQPLGKVLHSHVAGVLPEMNRPGIGRAMKLHQRAWCLDLGVTEVTWTFDPLVARNAHINITRLGADVDEYLIDFYGVMADGINAGQGSDRVVVRWHLDAPYFLTDPSRAGVGLPPASLARGAKLPWAAAPPLLTVAPDGLPAVLPATASAAVTLAIPRDIEGLRQTDPARASAWRTALRVAMAPLLADGWHVTGFHPVTGYLVERPTT